jgi:hypothetical protein
MSLTRQLDGASRALSIGVLVSFLAFAIGWWKRGELPPPSDLDPQLFSEPKQTIQNFSPYTIAYHHTAYTIEPVATYEIAGLVVSHNDIFQIGDIYHDEKSVDVRDLCFVFGPTAEVGGYHGPKFWSEPWTCWVKWSRPEEGERFAFEDLSNNHLLAESPKIREQIWDSKIGDQIRIRGKLINYYRTGFPEERRSSSLVRDDTGNGACEVLLVEEFEYLKRGNPGWNRIYDLGNLGLWWLMSLKIVSFVLFPWLSLKYG